MIGGVLATHAVVRPVTEGQEVALELDVLLAVFAEAVWVKYFWPRIGLQCMSYISPFV